MKKMTTKKYTRSQNLVGNQDGMAQSTFKI